MAELDDLDTGGVDIWDHKVAAEMRDVSDLFAELADESAVVAQTAAIYDHTGKRVKRFAGGLTAKAAVTLPAGCPWFELEFDGKRVRQMLATPAAAAPPAAKPGEDAIELD